MSCDVQTFVGLIPVPVEGGIIPYRKAVLYLAYPVTGDWWLVTRCSVTRSPVPGVLCPETVDLRSVVRWTE